LYGFVKSVKTAENEPFECIYHVVGHSSPTTQKKVLDYTHWNSILANFPKTTNISKTLSFSSRPPKHLVQFNSHSL
jgi:hypothetical protein